MEENKYCCNANFLDFCMYIAHCLNWIMKWGAYYFSSIFISDVATLSQKHHKHFIATYILCSKNIGNQKIEGSSLESDTKCTILTAQKTSHL